MHHLQLTPIFTILLTLSTTAFSVKVVTSTTATTTSIKHIPTGMPGTEPEVGTIVYSANQTSIDCRAPAPAKMYKALSGDSFPKIAFKFGVSLCALEQQNKQIHNPSFIEPGEAIEIPAQKCGVQFDPHRSCIKATGTASATLPMGTGKSCPVPKQTTYIVKANDTLYTIATEKYQLTLAILQLANPQIEDYDIINPGEKITIPDCATIEEMMKKATKGKSENGGGYGTTKGTDGTQDAEEEEEED